MSKYRLGYTYSLYGYAFYYFLLFLNLISNHFLILFIKLVKMVIYNTILSNWLINYKFRYLDI